MTPNISTSVAGISLSTCIYNASGPRSGSAEALHKIAVSKSGAVLSKSATLSAQNGNPQPRTWQHESASLNSEGLPNKGIDYYISEETISEVLEGYPDKPYFVSLSGKSTADNITMLQRIAGNKSIAAIELNLACPNIIGKPVVGYDFAQMQDILQKVSQLKELPPLGIKLPPYLDGTHFQQAAEVINRFACVKYVVAINTFGNATAVSVEAAMPYISANDGFAGLSGPAVKYTALANVRKLRALLRTDIDIVGVGGISTGRDVLEFLLCGCTAVQVGTQHWSEGPTCFDRLCKELSDLLQELGYKSVLQDVVGQLQPWNKEGAAKLRALAKDKKAVSSGVKSTVVAPQTSARMFQGLSLFLLVVVYALLMDKFVFRVPVSSNSEL